MISEDIVFLDLNHFPKYTSQFKTFIISYKTAKGVKTSIGTADVINP